MNKCLPVQVPPGPGNPSGLSAQGRIDVRLDLRRATQNRNFSGIWAQSKPGTRFERKRLMRMNHQGGF